MPAAPEADLSHALQSLPVLQKMATHLSNSCVECPAHCLQKSMHCAAPVLSAFRCSGKPAHRQQGRACRGRSERLCVLSPAILCLHKLLLSFWVSRRLCKQLDAAVCTARCKVDSPRQVTSKIWKFFLMQLKALGKHKESMLALQRKGSGQDLYNRSSYHSPALQRWQCWPWRQGHWSSPYPLSLCVRTRMSQRSKILEPRTTNACTCSMQTCREACSDSFGCHVGSIIYRNVV